MASFEEIMENVEALAVHCRPPLMDVESRARWMQDWCEDLKAHNVEDIRKACGLWRASGATKFPNPGQLLSLIQKSQGHGTSDREPYKPTPVHRMWSPPSEAEYRDLSIRQKIEYHQIMAHEIKGRAGPMFANGKHVSSGDMPTVWHSLQREAQQHSEKVKELRDRLAQYA